MNCSESALDNLVELIQEDTQDCLGIVKTIKKDILIPANSEKRVPCRAKTGYIDQTLPVLFYPDENTKIIDWVRVTRNINISEKWDKSCITNNCS